MNDAIKQRRKAHTIDHDLKRTRDRFKLKSTHAAITEALDAAPGLTTFDRERIVAQLHKRRADFKHAASTKAFRAQLAAWIALQALCIARFRELLPAMGIDGWTAAILLMRLPEFDGRDEEFPDWLRTQAKRETQGLKTLTEWISRHQRAVYRGAWRVLRECRDLDNNLADIADQMASKTWAYVANHVSELLNSSTPIAKRLSAKAENFTRAWKSERLRDDEGRPAVGYFIGLNGLERILQRKDGLTEDMEVAEEEVRDPNSDLNRLVIGRVPRTIESYKSEVRRVLRENRVGPFRAEDECHEPALAAA